MLETNFNKAVEAWMNHCRKPYVQFSSLSRPTIDCEAYREIVSMGHEALPLVRKLYDRDNTGIFELSIIQARLVGVVKEIVGENFKIPNELRGRISEIETYTKQWLDNHMSKYISE